MSDMPWWQTMACVITLGFFFSRLDRIASILSRIEENTEQHTEDPDRHEYE